jgi:hypothetical protein
MFVLIQRFEEWRASRKPKADQKTVMEPSA